MASAEATEAAVASLGGYAKGLYAEKWVPFVCELAVMVVRSRDGTVASFPVVQTIHKNNICSTTEAPAQVPADAQRRAARVAEQAVACLEGVCCWGGRRAGARAGEGGGWAGLGGGGCALLLASAGRE